MDLYLLNEIQKLKSGGGASSSGGTSPGIYPNEATTTVEAAHTVVSFSGIQERYFHQSRDWSSSHPYYGATFYVYEASDWRKIEACWRIPRGVGFYAYGGSHSHNTGNNVKGIRTHYANKRSVGLKHMQTLHGRATQNYMPIISNIMFVRNTTNNSIAKTVNWHYTNHWNSGYEGAALHVYKPNHVDYTSVTRQNSSWSTPWNTSSGGGQYSGDSVNVTFPANKTTALMLVCTASYWTNSSYWTHSRMANHFSQIDNIFDGTGQLVCDLQMSQVYKQATITDHTNENYNQNESFFRFYNKCGELFGNRTPA